VSNKRITHSQVSDNTPILVGAGQHVERLMPEALPPFNSPAKLAAHAAKAALDSTQIADLNCEIDTIAFVRLFSDSSENWKSQFGGSNNLPASLARLINAAPQHRVYSNAGGTEPLTLLAEMAQAIARGEKSMVLIAGAEAIAYQKHARRNQLQDDWSEQFNTTVDDREYRKRFACEEELNSGMTMPVHFYSLIENYQAHERGHTIDQHKRFMAELFAPFSKIAAQNPYSQVSQAHTPAQLAGISGSNYPLTIPYTKSFVARDSVNQAAAVLLCSAGKARSMGIAPEHWIFLQGLSSQSDQYLLRRPNPGSSEAMRRVIENTLSMAEVTISDIDLLDIYSCFPCAVTSVCDILNLPSCGSPPLTITGGLPFFGGPGNNYAMHALAEMTIKLRQSHRRGLITANGGVLSKHAAVVLSDLPHTVANKVLEWPLDEQHTKDEGENPQLPICVNPTYGTVITYTVIYTKNAADLGVVMGLTPDGERFLASSVENGVTRSMAVKNPIGRAIQTTTTDNRHTFTFTEI
jgi:acetyl-CoA C-acetyltransferase